MSCCPSLICKPYSSNLLVNHKQGMDVTKADESIKYTMLDILLVDGKEPGDGESSSRVPRCIRRQRR